MHLCLNAFDLGMEALVVQTEHMMKSHRVVVFRCFPICSKFPCLLPHLPERTRLPRVEKNSGMFDVFACLACLACLVLFRHVPTFKWINFAGCHHFLLVCQLSISKVDSELGASPPLRRASERGQLKGKEIIRNQKRSLPMDHPPVS